MAHLAASLLQIYPTAVGLKPPLSLLRAIMLPPNKMGLTSWGQSPRSSRLMKSVRAPTRCSDSPPNPTRSPKWPGLNPSGPGADPAGNVRTARSTSAAVTCHDPDASGVGSLPRATGSGSNGCFSIKSLRFCSFGIAGGAPSHKIRTAALILQYCRPQASHLLPQAVPLPPPAPSVGPRDQPLQPPPPSGRIPPLQKGMRPLAILWSGL